MITEDGIGHTLWQCSQEDSQFFEKEFLTVPNTYIADGHHRAASAFNVGKLRIKRAEEKGEKVNGNEPFNYFMAIHYPESYLRVYDYNRVVKSLNSLTMKYIQQKMAKLDLINIMQCILKQISIMILL